MSSNKSEARVHSNTRNNHPEQVYSKSPENRENINSYNSLRGYKRYPLALNKAQSDNTYCQRKLEFDSHPKLDKPSNSELAKAHRKIEVSLDV